MRDELVLICTACHKPVADGTGYIEVRLDPVHDAEVAVKEWRAAHPGPTFTGGELLDYPASVPWLIWHAACDPDPDCLSYHIEVERIRTPRMALSWTAHLMEKSWLSVTNWDDVIRSWGEES